MPLSSSDFAHILPGTTADSIACGAPQFQEANRILLAGAAESNSTDPYVRRIIDSARIAYHQLTRAQKGTSSIHKGIPVGVEVGDGDAAPTMSIGQVMRLLSQTGDERLCGIVAKIDSKYKNLQRQSTDAALGVKTQEFSLASFAQNPIRPSEVRTAQEAFAVLRRLDNMLKTSLCMETDLETQMQTLISLGAINPTPAEIVEQGMAIVTLTLRMYQNREKFGSTLLGKPMDESRSEMLFTDGIHPAFATTRQLSKNNIDRDVETVANRSVLTGTTPSMWMPFAPHIGTRIRSVQDEFEPHNIQVGLMNAIRVLDFFAQMGMNQGTQTLSDLLGPGRTYLQTASMLRGANAYIIAEGGEMKISVVSRSDVQQVIEGKARFVTPIEFKSMR